MVFGGRIRIDRQPAAEAREDHAIVQHALSRCRFPGSQVQAPIMREKTLVVFGRRISLSRERLSENAE